MRTRHALCDGRRYAGLGAPCQCHVRGIGPPVPWMWALCPWLHQHMSRILTHAGLTGRLHGYPARRRELRKLLLFAGLIPLVLVALPTASAAAETTTTFLNMSGEPGDFILGGQQRAFTPGNATFSESYDGSLLQVNVNTPDFEFWTVALAAPPGSPLVPGTYANAVQAFGRGPGQNGIMIFGDGRGCTSSGSFTVNEAVYGPHNYVQTFDATFTQFCDNSTAPLTGEVSIANPPPPPDLNLNATVATDGTVDRFSGRATVNGTVGCSEPVTLFLSATVVEVVSKTAQAVATFTQSMACTPSASPIAWSATVMSSNTVPFGRDRAAVSLDASATDPNFQIAVTQHVDAVVRLR